MDIIFSEKKEAFYYEGKFKIQNINCYVYV